MNKKISESTIEKNVRAYARGLGWSTWKWSSPGNRGVPDRIFMKKGKIVFIEFKELGKQPTLLQTDIHKDIAKQRFNVFVIDSVEKGRNLIDTYEKGMNQSKNLMLNVN